MIAGFQHLLAAVQHNCDVADARYAREVTLCTYLLEMREFFRWEQDLPRGMAPPRDEVGRWINEREARWDALGDADYVPLPVAGDALDPFAVADVNQALLPAGLVYGAGLGRFHKPHFFLGRLERQERHDDLSVLICDCEYARDITAIPAALQGDTVIVRREAMRQWLREKAEAWDVKRSPGAMARALAAYGYAEDAEAALTRMCDGETATLVLHEQGEHAASRLLGADWEAMLAGCSRRRSEIEARAVRDNLADCLVTLPTLARRSNAGSLHFWFANFDGMRREMFPWLHDAYQDWLTTGDNAPLEAAIAAGRRHWQTVAERLLAAHRAGLSADGLIEPLAAPAS